MASCSETFTGLFPKGPAYRVWAVIFTLVSLIFANFGLSAIIDYAVPVLMFLYPLAIVLILLALFGKFFSHDKKVYNWVISLTLISALYDLLRTLPAALRAACHLDGIIEAIGSVLPLRASVSAGSAPPPSVLSSVLWHTAPPRPKNRPHNRSVTVKGLRSNQLRRSFFIFILGWLPAFPQDLCIGGTLLQYRFL